MKKKNLSIATIALIALTTGCTSVTSSMPSVKDATGEAWYVKTTTLFGLPVQTQVFYCPNPDSGNSPTAVCSEAEILDEAAVSTSSVSAANGDIGALAQQQDTAPPRFIDLKEAEGRVTGAVEDALSNITLIQVSGDAGKTWTTLRVKDGALDSKREELDFPVPKGLSPGKYRLVIRAKDAAYNSALTEVEVNVNVLAAPPEGEPAAKSE
ncbi:MAG: hypothetical protein WC457_02195 [Patescibacteria group bacterium]